MNALKRCILWEYPRASWQDDVIVRAIGVFVFVTPPFSSFGDRTKPASVAIVHGGYWIDPQKLAGVPDAMLPARAAAVINAKFKAHAVIGSVEPIYDDSEQELKGYLAFPEQ